MQVDAASSALFPMQLQFSAALLDQGLAQLGQGAMSTGFANASNSDGCGLEGLGGWGHVAQPEYEGGADVEVEGWGGGVLRMPQSLQQAAAGNGYVDGGMLAYDQQQ
jgi:hypothetical protein